MAYELFVDVGEEPLSSTRKGVKKVKINRSIQDAGQKCYSSLTMAMNGGL